MKPVTDHQNVKIGEWWGGGTSSCHDHGMLTRVRNLWNEADAPADSLGQCVYGSRLLGSEPALVLHGGGNTSVKTAVTDITGEPVDVLHVKGSGWDLATIEPRGFAPLRLDRVRRLLTVERLGDRAMMNQLRCALLDADAPDPSVETLLHALLPQSAVLHSHADAVIAVTNQPDGEHVSREVFGDGVVVVPYVMPGFDLAKLCAELFPREANERTVGMLLLGHGLFTFGDDTKQAYDRHIDLVTLAQDHLAPNRSPRVPTAHLERPDHIALAQLRAELSRVAGAPLIVAHHDDDRVCRFVARPDLAEIARRGPATPDHVIRTKRVPMVGTDIDRYAAEYQEYVDEHRPRLRGELTPIDPAPRVVLDPRVGMLTAGRTAKDARIAADIYSHTIDIITAAEGVGQWQPLAPEHLFDVEYWELEQAKLRRAGEKPPFAGEVALVTGAASGIGAACADALHDAGAAVAGVDVHWLGETPTSNARLSLTADVTDPSAMNEALDATVNAFGGIDIVVVSAGVFPAAQPIAQIDEHQWRRTMAINVDSVASLFEAVHPLLARAPRGGRVAVIGSKNVPAPGPGAAAYSASKAALTQLARVAALEWAADGIRVNVVHPDAVFDTGLWTPEILAQRAAHYGLTVEDYRRRNLLGMEVSRRHVADAVVALCSRAFAATTGAQIPIDGGNERVV